jgi:hypothetical protein
MQEEDAIWLKNLGLDALLGYIRQSFMKVFKTVNELNHVYHNGFSLIGNS